MNYKINPSKKFSRKLQKLLKNNPKLQYKVIRLLDKLSVDPFSKPLRTHKVNISGIGVVFSSRLSGDIRIIWEFTEDNNLVILLIDIGGHSGKRGVY